MFVHLIMRLISVDLTTDTHSLGVRGGRKIPTHIIGWYTLGMTDSLLSLVGRLLSLVLPPLPLPVWEVHSPSASMHALKPLTKQEKKSFYDTFASEIKTDCTADVSSSSTRLADFRPLSLPVGVLLSDLIGLAGNCLRLSRNMM